MPDQTTTTAVSRAVSTDYEGLQCAMQVYGVIGIFGAARYGDRTQGNILVNRWLGGRAEGVLDLAIAAYLSISVPPMQVGKI